MTKFLIPQDTSSTTPLTIASRHWHKFLGNNVIDHVKTGLTFTSGGGLNASCAVGNGQIQGCYFETDATITIALTDNATNFIYAQLSRNGLGNPTDWSLVKNTTGTPPTDSMLLATVVTSAGAIGTITDKRTIKSDNQTWLARAFRYLSDNLINYIDLKAPTGMTTNKTYILPAVDGASGTILKSDGSGNWAFSADKGMVLINANDTDGTNVSENTTEQISKSYTLASNTYSKIIVEAIVHVTHGSFSGPRSVTVNIFIGATSKQYFHQINPAGNVYIEYDSPMKVSAALQAGGTIKVSIPAGGSPLSQNPSIQVKNMYVYGVL